MAVTLLGSRPISIVATIILARLLEPRDFGVVALAMVLFSTTNLFSGLGLGQALIHSRGDRGQIAYQAFIAIGLFSTLLFTVVLLNVRQFAELLGNPRMIYVLRWLSPLIIIDALYLVPMSLLKKEMMFKQVSKSVLASNVISNVLGISLAYFGFGIRSLIIAKLANSFTQLVVYWVACPGWEWLKPKRWDWEVMKELLRYGIQSTGSGFMSFFNTNWDDWLVGRVLGPTQLGFYSKAYGLTNNTIAGFNRTVFNNVLFPSYAKIQGQKKRLSRLYLKSLGMVALIMAPLSMGIFIVAHEIVPILIGEKWVSMIPTLQIFAFMALARPLAGSTAPLFQAVGRPDFNFRVGLFLSATMIPLVFLMLNYGIVGVAIAVTVSYVLGFFYNMYQVEKVLPGTSWKMVPAIFPSFVASGLMMLAVHFSKSPLLRWVDGQHNFLSVGGLIAIGAVVYIATAFVIRRSLIMETSDLILTVVKRKNRRLALGSR